MRRRSLKWAPLLAGAAIAACTDAAPTAPLPVAAVTPSPVPTATPAPAAWTLLLDDHNDKYGPFDPGIKGLGLIYTRVHRGRLELRIEGSTNQSPISGMDWIVYLDTDRNAGTGLAVEDIGADFTAGFGASNGNALLTRAAGGGVSITFALVDRFVELALPLNVLGNPREIDLVFRSVDLGPLERDQAPDRGHVTLDLTASTAGDR